MAYIELKYTYTDNPVKMYKNRKKLIKPQHEFIHCSCTETIKKHIPIIMNNLTYKKANLTPVVVIRDYNVNTEQVYRVVDLDPYDLNNSISIQCNCKNWVDDAIALGVFESEEHVNIEIEHEKEKKEKERYEELQNELEKQIQLENEKKLWYKIKKQSNKGLNIMCNVLDKIAGPTTAVYSGNSYSSHSSAGWIGGCY